MTPADLALENAMHFEGQKCAYRQTKEGVVVSFVVHPNDVPKGLAVAPLYSRYIVAVVQIGDDDQALKLPPAEKEISSTTPATPGVAHKPPPPAKREKQNWRDIPPAAQAAMLCDKPVFRAFLAERYTDEWHESMTDGAECVRLICGVASRSMLNEGAHRVIWHQLQTEYQAWEGIGA